MFYKHGLMKLGEKMFGGGYWMYTLFSHISVKQVQKKCLISHGATSINSKEPIAPTETCHYWISVPQAHRSVLSMELQWLLPVLLSLMRDRAWQHHCLQPTSSAIILGTSKKGRDLEPLQTRPPICCPATQSPWFWETTGCPIWWMVHFLNWTSSEDLHGLCYPWRPLPWAMLKPEVHMDIHGPTASGSCVDVHDPCYYKRQYVCPWFVQQPEAMLVSLGYDSIHGQHKGREPCWFYGLYCHKRSY